MPIFLSFILKSSSTFFIVLFFIGKKLMMVSFFILLFNFSDFFLFFYNFLIEKLNVLYEKNWTTLVHEQLRRFEGSIVAATRNSHNTDSSNVHNGVMMLSAADNGLDNGRWSFSEALLYSISVITTIGEFSILFLRNFFSISNIFFVAILYG